MVICFHCGKTTQFGRSYTHRKGVAGGRWKKRAQATRKIFKVNLQAVKVRLEDGKIKRVKVCSKCIKRVKKDLNDGKKPFLNIVSIEGNLSRKTSETKQNN
ncbi:MAG: hypothetical protein KatS3mg090_0768 [Patescibacteria group bacterium]|nr:MAG: hypothetical protein KatS3mg090_0768 [Patescibacteria group bacterium]